MVEFVKNKLPKTREDVIKTKIGFFSNKVISRWRSSGRNKQNFLNRNSAWLNQTIHSRKQLIPKKYKNHRLTRKSFNSVSTRTKRRRCLKLLKFYSPEELAFAARMSYVKDGKRNIAEAIKKVTTGSSIFVRKVKKGDHSQSKIRQYTPEEALALIVDTKMTKAQYLKIRNGGIERNCNIYPAYEKILKAKKECYPADILISENIGCVKLQSLLDHIAHRLSIVQKEVLEKVLLNKKFLNQNSDSDLLLTSIVPLQMKSESNIVLWQNPRCSSTRYCIPIKIEFIKENRDVVFQEDQYIENQISSLIATRINIQEKVVLMHHKLMKTMIDGKIANNLSNNMSSQTCYICKTTPKDMNNLDMILKIPTNNTTFQYGLSILHANIRFFECILHISYRLDLKTWRIQGVENKQIFQRRKDYVIQKFRSEIGLLVDIVKQGSGNTNDGNTARRFFKNPKQSSDITGVDEQLIYIFSVILQALSCGYKLDPVKFKKYALDTAELFVALYGWYKMPASVHKILIHGADVMDSLLLPIGK